MPAHFFTSGGERIIVRLGVSGAIFLAFAMIAAATGIIATSALAPAFTRLASESGLIDKIALLSSAGLADGPHRAGQVPHSHD